MAELHYKDDTYVRRNALQNLGNVVQRGRAALIQERMQQERLAQQEVLRRLIIQQQMSKVAAQQPMWDAQAVQRQAEAQRQAALAQQIQAQQTAGQNLSWTLNQMDQARQVPSLANDPSLAATFRAQLARNQAIIAALHPQNISEQVPRIVATMQDPRTAQLIATGQKPVMAVPNQGLYDVYNDRALVPPMPARGETFDQKRQLAREKLIGQMALSQMHGMNAAVPQFYRPDQTAVSNFASNAVQQIYGPQQGQGSVAVPAQKPIYARNKDGSQRLQSIDGGKTWTPVPSAPQSFSYDDEDEDTDNSIKAPTLSY